jgi:pimeloyl-ACP methyl ester carboxylesterase
MTPVVLLHAFPLDSRMWQPQVDVLSEKFSVIAPDLRGFGSAYPQLAGLHEISIDLAADDVVKLLDEQGIPKAWIGGISRGGYIAMSLARRYPDRLSGLMLLDTRAERTDDQEEQYWQQMLDGLNDEGMEFVAKAMKQRLFGPTALARRPELIQRVSEMIFSQKIDAVAAAARGMAARPYAKPALYRIKIPTLCVAGVEDGAFEATKEIARVISGARFIAVPDAGHLSNMERPDIVTEAIESFLLGR